MLQMLQMRLCAHRFFYIIRYKSLLLLAFYSLFFYSFCKVLIYRELSAFLFRLCINRIKRLKKVAKNSRYSKYSFYLCTVQLCRHCKSS